MNERELTLAAAERVHANAVESARIRVADAVHRLAHADALRRECQAAHARAGQALACAQHDSGESLASAQELVWSERHVRALRLDRETLRLRLLRAQVHFEQEEEKLDHARSLLRELELKRRAISDVIEKARSDAALVRCRRQEDERDDTFRHRSG